MILKLLIVSPCSLKVRGLLSSFDFAFFVDI